MRVKEIRFNHNTESAAHDAINLRHDVESLIDAPEWVDGEPSKPAAYARSEVKVPLTIKAKFSEGPPGVTLAIRAVAASPYIRSRSVPDSLGTRTVLGDVKKTALHFDENGDSGLVQLEITGRPDRAPVGISEATWTWKAMAPGSRWINFASTRHRVYVLPQLPTHPWSQVIPAQYPWAKAFEKALEWAAGATTVDETTALITKAINGHPKHVYNESGRQFVQGDPSSLTFNLTNYLWDLDNAASILIDCRGTATAMMTFANLLGADLSPLVFMNTTNDLFTTNMIRPFSVPTWSQEVWRWHEVALVPGTLLDANGATVQASNLTDVPWPTGFGQDQLIYDACLHLDETPPLLPVKMRFGKAGAGGGDYRDRLIAVGDADSVVARRRRLVV